MVQFFMKISKNFRVYKYTGGRQMWLAIYSLISWLLLSILVWALLPCSQSAIIMSPFHCKVVDLRIPPSFSRPMEVWRGQDTSAEHTCPYFSFSLIAYCSPIHLWIGMEFEIQKHLKLAWLSIYSFGNSLSTSIN